ncbi:MAG TPA: tetratricopeptide repeat protein [Thermomicrobiales bacterium]|nr:tetratricopeptide repeat protein [Thermomicrobiales bacterium]
MNASSSPGHPPLPVQLSSFIGRDAEIAQITRLLASNRLLTLTGPGGVGKTRLALAIANRAAVDYPDGRVFVSLAAVDDPSLVTATIAAALGITEQPGVPLLQELAARLRDQRALLVLDNFEQVIEAAPVVAELLLSCDNLRIIVTSREPLHLTAEQEFPAPPLALPEPQAVETVEQTATYEAVALFIQRARAINPNFALTTANAPAIVEICRRLDGLPLAIELAAARIKALTLEVLLARLHESLSLLSGGPGDQPVRQQTMRNAIAWSYDLLDPSEQQLFRQLSIFSGGWTLAAAGAVCIRGEDSEEDLLDQLLGLVDKHLIVPRPPATSEREDAPRFGMLQTIREFGQEQLALHDEADEVSRRHAAYMLEYFERAAPEWNSARDMVWLARGDAELDNVRSVLGWAAGHAAETALQLNIAFVGYWLQRGHFAEGRQWLELGLRNGAGVSDATRASALVYAGFFATSQGDYPTARALCEEALTISQRIGDRSAQAGSLYSLGRVAMYSGDPEQAYELYVKALPLTRTTDAITWLPSLLGNLAAVATELKDFAAADAYVHEALDISRAQGGPEQTALSLEDGAHLALSQSDLDTARAHLLESLTLQHDLQDLRITAQAFEHCAWLAASSLQPERTARLLGAAEAMRESIGVPVPPLIRRYYDTYVPLARSRVDVPTWDRAWAEGRSNTLDEAIVYAMDLPLEPEQDPVSAASTAGAAVDGLSRREVEVLRLLVEGRSNQEIAEALFISPHTAAKHVANIMGKLAVESRTAAATWAVRHGIG